MDVAWAAMRCDSGMGVREMEQARMKNGVMATDWRLGVRRAGRTLVPGWLDDVNRNVVVAVSDFPHAAAAVMSMGSNAAFLACSLQF